MGKITVETCEIEGLKIITPTVFGDARGYFMETYNYNDLKAAGIPEVFVQDNQSASKKGVLRGLHFQKHFPQDKLVRVIRGEVYDVAVDLREGSKTFGQWYGVLLSEENKKQFFIPKNFAHGFLVLSDYASSATNVPIFIIRMMRAVLHITRRISVWNGPPRRYGTDIIREGYQVGHSGTVHEGKRA